LSYWFLAQAYGQIEKKYEKSDIGVINSTTAVKIILSQNDNDGYARRGTSPPSSFGVRRKSIKASLI
jgi:hypothetical protein